MLNVLRPALSRVLTPVADALARTPVTPNALTITGTVGVTVGALWLFPTGHLFAGTWVCTGFVLTDMLDGMLARVKGTSDAAVFAGLTIWLVRTGQEALAWVALFCLVMGMMVSYAKARAEGLGIACNVGIAERTERLLITLVAAGLTGLGVPYVLAIGFWVLAVLSLITFGQRVDAVRRAAAGRPASRVPAGEKWRDDGSEPPDDSRAGAPS
jgi:CDP-diacylglycerol--glycerol-3-phosphate 3-phosphatidyltransferase